MKIQKLFLVLILCVGILFSGCIGQQNGTENQQTDVEYINLNSDSINPLNKNITKYELSGYIPKDLKENKSIIWYEKWGNDSRPCFSDEALIEESDLIFYGTVKEVKPSVWSTYSGKTPLFLYFTYPGKRTTGGISGSWEYKSVSSSFTQDTYIYTDIVFEVDDWVMGPATEDVIISVEGGQVGKFAMQGSYANPWNFEPGDKFLVYSKDGEGGRYEIVCGGLFIVNE
ncbi:hypothetical protein MsAg5_08410 [Methanosarcinaceae archaeon Ag5]|uniref:Lipoprotein n=1 Tax=Methanolapillus africanus TaxID=3028297 RepID=A0AAE4MKU7_9EURY|nr:hypothetical protein [Methanosarcinaceae archaeon Ag5]